MRKNSVWVCEGKILIFQTLLETATSKVLKELLILSTLLSVFALSTCSLAGHNRYGAPHSRNSLGYRGGSRYPSAPSAPSSPHSPRAPGAPSLPHAPRSPVAPAYGAPRGHGYGSAHHSGPAPYGGGRHFSPSNSGLNHYSGPSSYGGPVPYAGQVHAASGASHFANSKRSVYQPQESSYSSSSRSNYPQQNYAHSQQHAQSTAQTHGREMKYTIKDPQNRGTTHVTETHVVSNRQMHGAEAEAAMKKLMGSMGPGNDGGFTDFVKGMGLPFY